MSEVLEKLIDDSKARFGDRFSYDVLRETFTKKTEPADFVCKQHGRFTLKTLSNHIKTESGGCKECEKDIRSRAKQKTDEERKLKEEPKSKKKRVTVAQQKAITESKKEQKKIDDKKYAVALQFYRKHTGPCSVCNEKRMCAKCANAVRKNINRNVDHVCGAKIGTTSNVCQKFVTSGEKYCKIHSPKEPKKKKEKAPVKKCEYFKKSGVQCAFEAQPDNKWCGKHQRSGPVQEDAKNGVTHCANWKRDCDELVLKGKCRKCNDIENSEAAERKEKREKHHETQRLNDEDELTCVNCGQSKPSDEFVTSLGRETKKCGDCLEKQRVVEANRPERDRSEWSKMYHSLTQVKEKKREWREQHPDQVQAYPRVYRCKKIAENPEEYLKRNAEQQVKWRQENPEKYEMNKKRAKESGSAHLSTYKSSAKKKGIEWRLTDEEFLNMLTMDCFYCGVSASEASDGFNKVDRLDSDGIYETSNVRPCCTECNISKGGMSVLRFVSQVARIISFSFPDEFTKDEIDSLIGGIPYASKSGTDYATSKFSAEHRGIPFELTEEEYAVLIDDPCYLCNHRPENGCGLDRLDSLLQYIWSNCRACCATCNYMKNEYDLKCFLERCKNIVSNFLSFDRESLPEPTRPDRSTTDQSIRRVSTVHLTALEKRTLQAELISSTPDYFGVQKRIIQQKETDNDVETMKKFKDDYERKLVDALEEKRKKPLEKKKRKSKRTTEEEREKARLKKQRQRQAKAEKEGRIVRNYTLMKNMTETEKDAHEKEKNRLRQEEFRKRHRTEDVRESSELTPEEKLDRQKQKNREKQKRHRESQKMKNK